jgi:hypothetical protein
MLEEWNKKTKRKPPINPAPRSRALTSQQRRELAMSAHGFTLDASVRQAMRKRNVYLERVGGMYPERTLKQINESPDGL